jgi:hypothetical protein
MDRTKLPIIRLLVDPHITGSLNQLLALPGANPLQQFKGITAGILGCNGVQGVSKRITIVTDGLFCRIHTIYLNQLNIMILHHICSKIAKGISKRITGITIGGHPVNHTSHAACDTVSWWLHQVKPFHKALQSTLAAAPFRSLVSNDT